MTKISDILDRRIYEPLHKAMPEKTVVSRKTAKFFMHVGKTISSPEVRLITGVTALASQPFIDLHNKEVDEKTRIVSCAKTIAKIVVGTTTGVLVRHGCIKLAELGCQFKKVSGEAVKWSTLFTPGFATNIDQIIQHRKTIGTILAVVVSLFTNFAIDMPLTKFLTNIFTKKFENQKTDSKGGSK